MQNKAISPFSRALSVNGFNTSNAPVGKTRVNIVKTDEQRAIESKLISSPNNMRSPQQKGPDGTPFPNSQVASTIINDTAQNIIDGRNLTRLLPDIKVARMLLVSAIQSPNDLMSCSLTYTNDDDEWGNLKSGLLEIIQEEFEGIHKIDECVSVWLDEILFEKGAKAFMVLPESGLDEIINSDIAERINGHQRNFRHAFDFTHHHAQAVAKLLPPAAMGQQQDLGQGFSGSQNGLLARLHRHR